MRLTCHRVWCILHRILLTQMAMPLASHIIVQMGVDQLFRKLKPKPKLNKLNAHRSPIKICEKWHTHNVQFPFMPNAFRILKPIQKSSKRVWVFHNTGANAFAKNQMRLAYEDKRDLYCSAMDRARATSDTDNNTLYPVIHYTTNVLRTRPPHSPQDLSKSEEEQRWARTDTNIDEPPRPDDSQTVI